MAFQCSPLVAGMLSPLATAPSDTFQQGEATSRQHDRAYVLSDTLGSGVCLPPKSSVPKWHNARGSRIATETVFWPWKLSATSHCCRGRSLPHSSPLHQQPENRSRPITKTMQSLLEILGHPNYKKHTYEKQKTIQ